MHKKYRLLSIAVASLLILLGYGVAMNSAVSEEAKGRVDDLQAIKQAAAAYSAAFDRGDIDGLLSYWSPDAEYIDESGKTTQGHEAISALVRKHRENLKGYKLKLEHKALRFVTPDVAMVDGKATLVGPEGKEDVTPFAAVWVKRDGKWRVRSLRDLGDDDQKEAVTGRDHLKPLEQLLGDWVGTDKGAQVQLHCSWTLNKSFILMEYKIKKGDEESLTAQRFGWDPVNHRIRSWYFDSTGGYGEATWTDVGDGYAGEAGGVLPDGRIGTATYLAQLNDDGSFVFQVRNRTIDGRPLADAEYTFVRKAGKE
jgi:uncharacterized protein (TIGR02246 family)